jgi:hypothetical protein
MDRVDMGTTNGNSGFLSGILHRRMLVDAAANRALFRLCVDTRQSDDDRGARRRPRPARWRRSRESAAPAA